MGAQRSSEHAVMTRLDTIQSILKYYPLLVEQTTTSLAGLEQAPVTERISH